MAAHCLLGRQPRNHGGGIVRQLIVYPPNRQGWRRVRYDGVAIGVAHRSADIRVFLAAAGLENAEDVDLTDPTSWNGGERVPKRGSRRRRPSPHPRRR